MSKPELLSSEELSAALSLLATYESDWRSTGSTHLTECIRAHIAALEAEIAALKKREAFMRSISPNIAQMFDEYDAPADAELSVNGGKDE